MIKWLLNLIFPPKCIFCSNILGLNAEIHICKDCYKKIPFIDEAKAALKKGFNYYDDIVCVCEYSGIIKNALRRFKFSSKPAYARTLSLLLVQELKKMTNSHKFDIIISVPLHKQKEQERGYNQSYLISKEISRELGYCEQSMVLKRIRNTGSQSRLDKSMRMTNVKDAFRVDNVEAVKGKTILLVDDILTTGNTINECCRVLKQAGAAKVIAAVIASGRKF